MKKETTLQKDSECFCEVVRNTKQEQSQTDEEFWNMIEKIESGWRDGSWKYV